MAVDGSATVDAPTADAPTADAPTADAPTADAGAPVAVRDATPREDRDDASEETPDGGDDATDGAHDATNGDDSNVALDVPVVVDVASAMDAGSAVDVAVPVDRGSPVDVPVDRGNPVDVRSDVPVDRGNPVDVGSDVPVDRGTDVGFDVPAIDTEPTGEPPPDDVTYTGSFAARTGRFTVNLTVQGARRSIVLVVPTNAGVSPPLLMIFHGTNGDGAVAMTESNAQALANSQGVIVAAPTSRWRPVGDFDHATEETYWETAPNNDVNNNQDLVLVRAIMVEAQRAYGVDPARIFAMGHSNGAFFAHFVAVLLGSRIAAFSENSGGLVRCARTTSCSFQGSGTTCAALRTQSGYCNCAGPELPVAVPTAGRMPPGFLTHGTRDPLVSVFYTCTLADLMTARGHTQVTQLFDGEGHGVPTNWAQLVWPFFANRRLGDR